MKNKLMLKIEYEQPDYLKDCTWDKERLYRKIEQTIKDWFFAQLEWKCKVRRIK